MKTKSLLTLLLLLATTSLFSQLTYLPEKPKPGDKITFIYMPPVTIFSTTDTIKCVANLYGESESDEGPGENTIALTRNGYGYEGIIMTKSTTKAVTLDFTTPILRSEIKNGKLIVAEGKVDFNNGNGYCILLYTAEGRECDGACLELARYLWSTAQYSLGIPVPKTAGEYLKRELELTDNELAIMLLPYVISKENGELRTAITAELNKQFEKGPVTETDYRKVTTLTSYLGMSFMSDYFRKIAEEKFISSGGIIQCTDIQTRMEKEQDPAKKTALLDEALTTYDQLSEPDKEMISRTGDFRNDCIESYLMYYVLTDRLADFIAMQKKYNYTIEAKPEQSNFFFDALNSLQERGKFADYTEKTALEYAAFFKKRLDDFYQNNAEAIRKNMDENINYQLNQYRVTATGINYLCAGIYQKQGQWNKALSFAKENMTYIKSLPPYLSKNFGLHNTQYIAIAEHVLPVKQCKTEIENFIKADAWTQEMIDVLRRLYLKENKSDAGFDEYVASLKKANLEKKKEELLEEKLNEPAADFTLTDTDGSIVTLSQLKGKIIILDFWATWCGPCKSSFPAMQVLVDKYKNSPEVKIFFINTFEKYPTDKEKLENVTRFIAGNKYSFQVLMDNKNKVAESYKVNGIPVKFIIDKHGVIRYKITGGETNAGKLLDEMEIMINSVK
jgi:thiol-disulfide isomerase/thioredoxin